VVLLGQSIGLRRIEGGLCCSKKSSQGSKTLRGPAVGGLWVPMRETRKTDKLMKTYLVLMQGKRGTRLLLELREHALDL